MSTEYSCQKSLTMSCVPGGKSRLVTSVLLAPPDVDQPLSGAVERLGDVVGVASDRGGDGGGGGS